MNIIKKYYVRAAFVAMSATSVAGFAACGGFNLVSLDEEVQLGQQLDQEIRNNPAQYPILNNAAATSYLQNMANTILQSDEIKYRGKFPYTVTIIRDDKTVNAFATPGGYIYVYTGLIKMLDNEASMAGVMGHEIAHSEERHGTEAMSKQYGAQMLLGILLGNNPGQLTQIAGNLVTGLAVLKNGRDAETEADELSFRYLQDTPWYPG
ncbi:MAG: M48 family metalloprotease, partial [Bacteroidota bacterium]